MAMGKGGIYRGEARVGVKEGKNRFVKEGGAKLGKNGKILQECWAAVYGFLPRVAGG